MGRFGPTVLIVDDRLMKSLADLRRGALAVVSAVSGVQFSSKHLADMGFVRGAKVEMLRPGSPCIVKIDDTVCVALGTGYQQRISVELLDAASLKGSTASAT
jgi:Fe2+ transport system protein FeoA